MSRLSSALVIFLARCLSIRSCALWEYQTFDFTSMGNYFGGVSSSSGSDTSCGWELDRRASQVSTTETASVFLFTKHSFAVEIERGQFPDIDGNWSPHWLGEVLSDQGT